MAPFSSFPAEKPPIAATAVTDPLKACHQCRRTRNTGRIISCGDSDGDERPFRNCNLCMKKMGRRSVFKATSTVEANGLASVLERLQKTAPGRTVPEVKSSEILGAPPEKPKNSVKIFERMKLDKGAAVTQKEAMNEKNVYATSNDADTCGNQLQKKRKVWSFKGSMWVDGNLRSCELRERCNEHADNMTLEKYFGNEAEEMQCIEIKKAGWLGSDVKAVISPKVIKPTKRVSGTKHAPFKAALPEGTRLMTVAGIELLAEDVGPALQFLEFCAAFGNVFSLTKGQPELLLRELLRGRAARWTVKNSLVAQFHIRLLLLLQKDRNKSARSISEKLWLHELKRYIDSSQVPIDLVGVGVSGYDNLEPSRKLRILNFLCDEILGTECLRSLIDEERVKYVERKKDDREKQLSVKEDHPPDDAAVLKKFESSSKNNKMQRSDAFRTEPLTVDESGHAFWKVSGYRDSSRIVLQDIKNWDMETSQDTWFVYDDDQEKLIQEHVSSLKNWRLRKHRELMRQALLQQQV